MHTETGRDAVLMRDADSLLPPAGPPVEGASQPEAGHVSPAGAAVGAGCGDQSQTAGSGGAA